MQSPAPGSDREVSEVDLALCRATLYNALALGFRPPAKETLDRLIAQEGAEALADAAAVLDERLASAAQALAHVRSRSLPELSASFRRLFGHTARGPVPPYETEYGQEVLFQQPQELADLAGFYRAFSLKLSPAEHERLDHISCECEFLSFLALKEAYAREHYEEEKLLETRKAERLFLRDHLGRFGPVFGKKLGREDKDGFYGTLGELCQKFIADECARLDVPAGPETLPLRTADTESIPMACSEGEECPLIPGDLSSKGLE
ncbi:MAG: molecular chaperone TorD family protein [Candidatus Binatia bacterium]|nr:molecular chaperone TorD family protein [Candidatus Binatia bacterium]